MGHWVRCAPEHTRLHVRVLREEAEGEGAAAVGCVGHLLLLGSSQFTRVSLRLTYSSASWPPPSQTCITNASVSVPSSPFMFTEQSLLCLSQAVGTARPCYVCNKPTTVVLATINTVDFLYTCDTHLSDPGFASQVGSSNDGVGAGGAKKMGLSPEEIAKVKAEYEERQKKRVEKAKEKEADKDGKEDQEKDAKGDKKSSTPSSGTKSPPYSNASPSPGPAPPTHQRYTLHRDMFALRLAEHRRRRQAAQAKELAPRLPGAPVTSLP